MDGAIQEEIFERVSIGFPGMIPAWTTDKNNASISRGILEDISGYAPSHLRIHHEIHAFFERVSGTFCDETARNSSKNISEKKSK